MSCSVRVCCCCRTTSSSSSIPINRVRALIRPARSTHTQALFNFVEIPEAEPEKPAKQPPLAASSPRRRFEPARQPSAALRCPSETSRRHRHQDSGTRSAAPRKPSPRRRLAHAGTRQHTWATGSPPPDTSDRLSRSRAATQPERVVGAGLLARGSSVFRRADRALPVGACALLGVIRGKAASTAHAVWRRARGSEGAARVACWVRERRRKADDVSWLFHGGRGGGRRCDDGDICPRAARCGATATICAEYGDTRSVVEWPGTRSGQEVR
jgi:hypothetical protein